MIYLLIYLFISLFNDVMIWKIIVLMIYLVILYNHLFALMI
jgi:hypothetical protein